MTIREMIPALHAGSVRAVTPSDTATLANVIWVYVGGAGDLSVQGVEDTAPATIQSVPAGTILDIRALRIMQTGTTATKIAVGISNQ